MFQVFDQVYGPANMDGQWGRRTPDGPIYTSRVEDLHGYTLKGGDVAWIQPPPGYVGHVLRRLSQGPHEPGATALLLIPQWKDAPWWPLMTRLELLHDIEKGSRVFTRPGTEEDIVVRPGWAYGLYRYRVPPEEEEETIEEGVAYSLPAEGGWRTPVRRGRQLVTFAGQLAGKKVNVLIDSGSTLDLISTGRAQELGVATHSGGPNKVRLADGSLQACEETVDPVRLRVGAHVTTQRFHVTDLHTFDVILGKQWLTEFNPEVCWRTNEVVIREDGRVTRLTPTPPRRKYGPVEVVSYTQARRAITRGHDAWVGHLLPLETMEVLLAAVDEVEIWEEKGKGVPIHKDPEVQRLLRKYPRLFRALKSIPPSE